MSRSAQPGRWGRRAAAFALALAGCASPPPAARTELPPEPEIATGVQDKAGWQGRRFAIAAAHPLAAQAGARVLRAGGAAIDAAVAAQMVLALVEPQSSGIGGGAFLLHWDGETVQAWDGRETAPAAVDERLLLDGQGKPLPIDRAKVGGRAVGVPGAVRMLEAVHRSHGRLPWPRLFEPAVELAENGFAMGARLHGQLAAERHLRSNPQAFAYFYRPDGQPHPVGHVLRNPALAAVLRAIADGGSAALHQGGVAADIVRRVHDHAGNPGWMTDADLADYRPVQRAPICTDWKARYRVCGMPPPSSGHLTVMQILGMLEAMPAVGRPLESGVPGVDFLHPYAEAARLAFADRNRYVGDPDFVAAPAGRWDSLLAADYLRRRAALIGPRRMDAVEPGVPGVPGAPSVSYGGDVEEPPEHGTSHLSIVDADGRAVALTTTIEDGFGARLMSDGGTGLAGGFLLNNELTDFTATPRDREGRPVANRVQPGKRPRSSMSPTLVFDRSDGRLVASLGSAGGAVIIHYVAKTLLATLDWQLDPQEAAALPNFGSFGGPVVLETRRFPMQTVTALQARGHEVVRQDLTSGVHALVRGPAGDWRGGADPRREGIVLGE